MGEPGGTGKMVSVDCYGEDKKDQQLVQYLPGLPKVPCFLVGFMYQKTSKKHGTFGGLGIVVV